MRHLARLVFICITVLRYGLDELRGEIHAFERLLVRGIETQHVAPRIDRALIVTVQVALRRLLVKPIDLLGAHPSPQKWPCGLRHSDATPTET